LTLADLLILDHRHKCLKGRMHRIAGNLHPHKTRPRSICASIMRTNMRGYAQDFLNGGKMFWRERASPWPLNS
jgi:hypothetical protein